MQKHWDIFCRVIDNYGDVGVCWRLARQLVDEFDVHVRLWLDDLSVLKKFCPDVVLNAPRQICAGVSVCRWTQPLPQALDAADIVIEAFACEIPTSYRTAMEAKCSLWINLEYLSAEFWVSDCHGLPSPQAGSSLKKFFFFPGFRPNTGGVLGEHDLAQQRRSFQNATPARDKFLRRFIEPIPERALRVSLFAYRDAPIESLLRQWSSQPTPICCFVPEGQPLVAVSAFFAEDLDAGAIRTTGNLTVCVLPFLSQDDYDQLLWSCDLNFVRGEDSFVRAQWAARPLVWQIYAQPEHAHWPKLEAFLQLYGDHASTSAASALRAFWYAWNGDGAIETAWPAYATALPALRAAAESWTERLEAGPNLAAALVQFCANQV